MPWHHTRRYHIPELIKPSSISIFQAQHQALTGQALQSASGQTGQTPPSTTPNTTQFNNIAR